MRIAKTNYNTTNYTPLKNNKTSFGISLVFDNPEKELAKDIFRRFPGSDIKRLAAFSNLLNLINKFSKEKKLDKIVMGAMENLDIPSNLPPKKAFENYENDKLRLGIESIVEDGKEKIKFVIKNESNTIVGSSKPFDGNIGKFIDSDFAEGCTDTIKKAIPSAISDYFKKLIDKNEDVFKKIEEEARAEFNRL